ncbi:MAG: putative Ig domain-containing protein [Thermodesulfovibrionales bacterium]
MMKSSKFKVQSSKFRRFFSPQFCIFIFAFCIFLVGCKAKEAPKVTAPSQPVEVAIPSVETKELQPTETPLSATTNRPPQVTSVDVTPNFPKVGDTLKITATAIDPDKDEVTFIYQWFKNEELLQEETSDTLSLKGFKRGDRIMLNVIPYDGKEKGSPGLMKVTIGNISPEITSNPNESRFENRRFTYQVKATDSENDPLTYSLKAAPTGMTIDKSTGLIQWDVPPDFRGKASVIVSVTDNQGGEGLQSFIYDIAAEK